ncbi:unnamed protein product [Rhodiola kirilowii]
MFLMKEYLDLFLVPSGLVIMSVYHLYLLYRYLYNDHTTVIGFENNDKRAWVERIMQLDKPDLGIPLTVLSNNTSAATYLASVSLTLSAIIGAWTSSTKDNIFQSSIIYGDTTSTIMSMKYITLLTCFIMAFSFFVQSARCLVHANYLITTPNSNIPTENVVKCVIKGGDFWTLGLRALYFAINLLMWFFGPVPMFATSIVMVVVLHYLDWNSSPLHRHWPPVNHDPPVSKPRSTQFSTPQVIIGS